METELRLQAPESWLPLQYPQFFLSYYHTPPFNKHFKNNTNSDTPLQRGFPSFKPHPF